MAHHAASRSWLDSVLNGPSTFGVSPQVLSSMVRVVTNRHIFRVPKQLEEALAFCNALLDHPQCQIIQPGPRHWSVFQDLCRTADARGSLVADAWFAALAIESGCEWITYDRD